MPRRIVALGALIAIVAAPALAPAATPRALEERDLRAYVSLSNPKISPDGTRIALIVRRADFAKNINRNELVLVNVRDGTTRMLVGDRKDVSSPSWSPSGDRLAFVATPRKEEGAKDEPTPQLYALRLDGGEAARVTDAKKGVESYGWRPDGRAFAYLTADESPDAKRIKAKEDWFEVTDDAWTARAAPVPTHLWTIDANGKHARRITHGTWSLADDPSFTPDGRSVFLARTPSANTNRYRSAAIVRVDLAGGKTTAVTSNRSSANSPAVTPDGNHLIYHAEHPTAFSQSELYESDLAGHNVRDLTARLDRNVQFTVFAPHGTFVVGANDATHDRLFALAPDGTPHVLPLAEVNVQGAPTAADDGTLAFVGATPARPAELYVLAVGAKGPRRLSRYNDAIAAHALGRTRTIAWRGAGGFAVDGVITEPVGMVRAKRYPMVVLIHGGPTATSTEAFSSLAQLMAARGWIVFQPNYRGSDNLGHRFAQATIPHITSAPAQDVLDGVDAVTKTEIVDTTRIGVSGWSEGGLLTSWLIAHDHRWRAAMSGAAVNDWTGYGDMTDAKDFSPSFIGPSPWTSARMRALYEAESPLTYASEVKTPTLILTDAGDQRVPTPLSYEFYHAIRATGTPVEMTIFPVNGHNPGDPLHREERTHLWVDWFAKHF